MLDYSIAAIKMIYDDLKKWCKVFRICFPIFTLAYYIYALVMDVGNLYVNIVLISLFVIYTTFELCTCKKDKKKMKKARRTVSKIYKWLKLGIKTFTLGSMLYGIYMASSEIDGISIILAVLTIILWVLQVLLEIIIAIVEPRARLVYAGVLNDAKPLVNKANYILPLFKVKKIVINTDDYQKELLILEKKVELSRKDKKEKEKVEPLKVLGMVKKELKKQENNENLENFKSEEVNKIERNRKKDKENTAFVEVPDIVISDTDVLIDESEIKKGKTQTLTQKGMEIVSNFFKKKDQKQENTLVKEDDEFEKVKKLKELLDMGAITKKEFEEKKKQILGL